MNPIWDWMDSIIGAVSGAITASIAVGGACYRWVNNKFAKAEEEEEKERNETNTKVNSLLERVMVHDKEIATIMANERHTAERLTAFQVVITSVNEKQDRQTALLNQIVAQNEIILNLKHAVNDK